MDDALAAYDFDLPDDRIAREPPPLRDGGRLLDLERGHDGRIADVVGCLVAGDVVVVNEVKVHRARVRAVRESGGRIEVLLVRALGDGSHEALLRPARRLRAGEVLRAGDGTLRVDGPWGEGTFRVTPLPDVDTVTASAGEVPLPPYLHRAPTAADVERYQTVYARGEMRAAAAPTAGLHFTAELLAAIDAVGARRVAVSLEVGLGTFQPLRPEQLAAGKLHVERFDVPEATWSAVTAAAAEGRRVIAIGTTSLRVLEAATGPGPGETDLFIRPGYTFRRVDRLFTNFHLPRSSLLMLVCAFGGTARVLTAYRRAVDAGYRFYSYGDAMWIDRRSD